MVIRAWRARASREGAAAYQGHFETAVRCELEILAGFRGAVLLTRAVGEGVEILVETRWSSREAIRAFAGDAVEVAVVEPAARAVLAEFDRHVAHYDVVAELPGHDEKKNQRLPS